MAVKENRKIVYILDDDPTVKHTLALLLEKTQKIRCYIFEDPEELYKKLEYSTPDAVIVDCYFENYTCTGTEVVKKLRELHKILLILGISDTDDRGDFLNMLRAGANNVIQKKNYKETKEIIFHHFLVREQSIKIKPFNSKIKVKQKGKTHES